ncbi:S-adenosyl-L-methionine-dependentmethyltransferases superfamily protein [Striga asiatica]|uniref:S-adenosyl-L-methionine-dependentmethyltransferases superfamily protein n=1 Tax=Striga asiatica TaxID=4170 RepID=A0A5A7RCF6_STRAF|nr:S-adenosyl-L-methionine-dependentmethyltransferases superfamily protein [Striga asiatica]
MRIRNTCCFSITSPKTTILTVRVFLVKSCQLGDEIHYLHAKSPPPHEPYLLPVTRPQHDSQCESHKVEETNDNPLDHSYPVCLNIVPLRPLAREQLRNNRGKKKSSQDRAQTQGARTRDVPRRQRQGYSALRIRADINDPKVARGCSSV